ncbi:hypothetical protein G7Y89_g10639 [Cudoniella acicularis]|uniref:Actin-like ATPase domain-containing protein n=1 Tax=Cudoniella acicularis TaxID=354080 RepID=A0A8H4RCD2_9HELO|nr:hypothetical protein G7Y89_g10639 [Cudoniella acicularis]
MSWPDGALAMRHKTIDYDDDGDDVMVIGIDFGTTYSGVAWATVSDFTSDQINFITSWPGTGREEGKAPTELFYEDGQIMWGYEIPADADPVRWFKLLLLKEEDLDHELRSSEFLLRGRKMLKENNKTAVDLIADYLQALWKHVLDTISKARGESVVDALSFKVVITVPAIWKGYARQGMQEAAKKAGILDLRPAGPTTLTFAPEPEAAALSTLCEPGRRIKKGDVFVICDAGGGTVDLISYKIDEIDPIEIHEAVEGKGGLCGGIFIDEAFEHMCKSRLGRKWDRLSKAGIKEIMKGEWEHAIKPQFKPLSTKKEYIVGIPAEAFGKASLDDTSREPLIKNGRIHFNGSHIQKAFTEAFSGIEKLIDEQINKAQQKGEPVTGIVLVGGLGASPYLYEHLNKRHSQAGITVLQSGGMKPRTAICRGAVFKGFLDGGPELEQNGLAIDSPILVTSTISRINLGLVHHTPFKEGQHLEEDKKWFEDEGEYKAENQMQWYLKRGDNVSTKDSIRHSFYRTYKKDFGGYFTVEMHQCEDIVAPTRVTPDMKVSTKIRCMLDIPFSNLEDFVSRTTGEIMKRMFFEVEMVPSGASVEFTVYIGGRKQGQQNANIQFH